MGEEKSSSLVEVDSGAPKQYLTYISSVELIHEQKGWNSAKEIY